MSDDAAWRTWDLPVARTTLREWQARRCAMCGYEDRLVKDHCHDTGFIRGLLCHSCNGYEGRSFDGEGWDEWRAGDHPARAIGHLELYANTLGQTPFSHSSALYFYTDGERAEWWKKAQDDFAADGTWPLVAPWSADAIKRRDISDAEAKSALDSMWAGVA